MSTNKLSQYFLTILLAGAVVLALSGISWAHGGKTSITPDSLNVKAGSELKVTVNGLEGSKEAVFTLTGMTGKIDLGKYPIASDDFTQSLQIPPDLPPGSYRLSVDGGEQNAKVIITIY